MNSFSLARIHCQPGLRRRATVSFIGKNSISFSAVLLAPGKRLKPHRLTNHLAVCQDNFCGELRVAQMLVVQMQATGCESAQWPQGGQFSVGGNISRESKKMFIRN